MSRNESKSTVLLKHHLKALKMPTMLGECEKVAARCAKENVDHLGFLLQLCELEMDELVRTGFKFKADHDELLPLFDFADEVSEDVLGRLAAKEFQARAICIMIADESERRRTGKAPRAKRMH